VKTKVHQDEFYQGSRFPLSPYSKYEGRLVFKIPESIKPSEVCLFPSVLVSSLPFPSFPLLSFSDARVRCVRVRWCGYVDEFDGGLLS
jgi:hypothetical protein